jgi:hypothetical protein
MARHCLDCNESCDEGLDLVKPGEVSNYPLRYTDCARATSKQEVTDYLLFAQPDFAERFERGKLSFTGDVLQVISVFDGQR